jgi:hypothetical protein
MLQVYSRGNKTLCLLTTDLGVRGSTPLGRANFFNKLGHHRYPTSFKPEADRKQQPVLWPSIPTPSTVPVATA